MKTIAITIEEPMLERLDRLVEKCGRLGRSRSQFIRQALREYVARMERQAEEEREREIIRRHRNRLERQAAALVREQAKP